MTSQSDNTTEHNSAVQSLYYLLWNRLMMILYNNDALSDAMRDIIPAVPPDAPPRAPVTLIMTKNLLIPPPPSNSSAYWMHILLASNNPGIDTTHRLDFT